MGQDLVGCWSLFGVIVVYFGIHYLLWGWMMKPKKTDEPDEEERGEPDTRIRAERSPKAWPLPDSDSFTQI
jgi:hypothetical protein